MKFGLLVTLALCSSLTFAQSQSRKRSLSQSSTPPSVAPSAAAIPTVSAPAPEQSEAMKILLEKLQIRYFGEFLGGSLSYWEDNQVETTKHGSYTRSNEPMNMFHQLSTRWKVGEGTRAFVDLRAFTQFGDRNEIKPHADQQVIVQDTHRIGVSHGYYKSDDKTTDATFIARVRMPTSQAAQNDNQVMQMELLNILSWQATPDLNFGLSSNLRYYWYEQKVDSERYRIYSGPEMTYTFNDTYSFNALYEHELQHIAPEGKRMYRHTEVFYQDLYLVLNAQVTPSLTLGPLLLLKNLKRWNWETQRETTQIGLQVSGVIF